MTPERLSAHYSRFRVADRILLTGHSHQAWPDVAFEGQQQAWLDAAAYVDDKWERAAVVAEEVRAGWRRLLNDSDGDIALGQNTHELVVRLLSAILPMAHGRRIRLVTTDGEFHTIRRQLDRLAEVGVEVMKIAARPVETLADRLASAIDDRAAGVLVSSVLFETAEIVPNLSHLAAACAHVGAHLLVDAYHHLNVVPFDLAAMGLSESFVVGGGYKYCQLGEGNCFLRLPSRCRLRPVVTGWFSEFSELTTVSRDGDVPYGAGAASFAGATYDPTAHYRAARVFQFHEHMQLTPPRLREISCQQTSLLTEALHALDRDSRVAAIVEVPAARRAGFVALRMRDPGRLVDALRERQVFVDARGDVLRIGPAPYVTDRQLTQAVALIDEHLDRADA